MATTSRAIPLTLSTLSTIPDPTAEWGSPAKRVQVQNASAFIITCTINGETYNLQSFTAQTLPTAGDGSTLLILPTSGPGGTQGSLTAVWLDASEDPPMADGQLTGAAQYAQGLGTVALPPTNIGTSPANVGVSIPPNARTVIIKVDAGVGGVPPSFFAIVGTVSGYVYYDSPPYLIENRAAGAGPALVICPVLGVVDPSILIETAGFAGPLTISVWTDTAAYDESLFYNGPAQANAAASAGGGGPDTLLVGPARLLAASLSSNAASECLMVMNGTRIMQLDVPTTVTMNFPDNTILANGQSLLFDPSPAALSSGEIVWAYP